MTTGCQSPPKKEIFVSGVKIFYGSQTGTAKVTSKNVCAFLVATYTDGRPTESAEWFCKWLEEASSDFRFGKTYLKGMKYAVFGLGNSAYVSHFNKVGKNVDKWLWMLGAHRVMTRGEGDCDVVKSKHGSIEADFRAWKAKFISRLQALRKGEKKSCGGNCKKGKCESNQRGSEGTEPGPHPPDRVHQRDAEVRSLHVCVLLLPPVFGDVEPFLWSLSLGLRLEGRSETRGGVLAQWGLRVSHVVLDAFLNLFLNPCTAGVQ
ncbi:hypothetical protein CB1_001241021 [Camelus ferus]|nr:hypothetical protein CB1_001241021 [Camelus ferus]